MPLTNKFTKNSSPNKENLPDFSILARRGIILETGLPGWGKDPLRQGVSKAKKFPFCKVSRRVALIVCPRGQRRVTRRLRRVSCMVFHS